MNRIAKMSLLGLGLFAVAHGLRLALVPDILPVASEEKSQPIWAFETAFVLQSLENIGLLIAAISVIVGAAAFLTWTRPAKP